MDTKPVILVSRCLLGDSCRYDGNSKPHSGCGLLSRHYTVLPICPECDGGLPTPRPPAERQGEKVVSILGVDVTKEYLSGAQNALTLAKERGAVCAILKLRSPACGVGEIYDGTYSGTLTPGNGVTAELLINHGIPVYGETAVDDEGYITLHPFLHHKEDRQV